MRSTFTHETTITLHDKAGRAVGDIDVLIEYHVTNYGCPAKAPEVDVFEVKMLDEPVAGDKAKHVLVWGWLYEVVLDWANENASEFAAKKSAAC